QRAGLGHALRCPLLPFSAAPQPAADRLAADAIALEALSSRKMPAA
ncbi:4-hydroxy-tetrahydrodipicolinate synthase, partial [Xanthomonas perforans]